MKSQESCDGSILKLTWPAYQPITNTRLIAVYNGRSSRRPHFPFEFPRKSGINGNISLLPSLPQRVYSVLLLERGTHDITPNGCCLSITRALYTRLYPFHELWLDITETTALVEDGISKGLSLGLLSLS